MRGGGGPSPADRGDGRRGGKAALAGPGCGRYGTVRYGTARRGGRACGVRRCPPAPPATGVTGAAETGAEEPPGARSASRWVPGETHCPQYLRRPPGCSLRLTHSRFRRFDRAIRETFLSLGDSPKAEEHAAIRAYRADRYTLLKVEYL